MRRTLRILLAEYRIAVLATFQYRVQASMSLLGLLFEGVIYLAVWTAIARARGGEVAGLTAGEFAGYFIGWTFVRNITTGWSLYWMEERIRRGDFNALLTRPIHPYVTDMGRILGDKTVSGLALIPTTVLLAAAFRPEFHLVPWALAAVIPAMVLAFLLRYTALYLTALAAFWTTRIAPVFELWFLIEFFLSGRVAPLAVLPAWGQQLASALPFRWMFSFPLELLLGRVSPTQTVQGFLMQALWLAVVGLLMRVIWRSAVRQYGAVGG
jgi:ABC-2 type transport system permease protein